MPANCNSYTATRVTNTQLYTGMTTNQQQRILYKSGFYNCAHKLVRFVEYNRTLIQHFITISSPLF
ncbi:MAG: hypothetical protein VB046_05480 [Paludibacter sp.]|nr:hypothetical protein [Paludibacter sp.]